MAKKLRFDFTPASLATVIPTAGGASGDVEPSTVVTDERLRSLGVELASNQFTDDYLWSRMGGSGVQFRASVIRITFFKLLGTGLAALFMALSPHVGRYTGFSCALAAAVNLVACGHYWFIWQVRLQVYRGPRYERWMARVGRVAEEKADLLTDEREHDARAVFWQEVTVDGLRFSDWLFLMTLDLGHLREYLFEATAGQVPAMALAKEWVAFMQASMIFCASVWRFYTNEARSRIDASSETGLRNVGPGRFLLSWGAFLSSCALFVLIVYYLVGDLPVVATLSDASVRADVIGLQVLVYTWIGYPLVALAARIGHTGVRGDRYIAFWSTVKDVSFAFLDVTSKGGLAIFFVLKASYVDNARELAIIAAAHASAG